MCQGGNSRKFTEFLENSNPVLGKFSGARTDRDSKIFTMINRRDFLKTTTVIQFIDRRLSPMENATSVAQDFPRTYLATEESDEPIDVTLIRILLSPEKFFTPGWHTEGILDKSLGWATPGTRVCKAWTHHLAYHIWSRTDGECLTDDGRWLGKDDPLSSPLTYQPYHFVSQALYENPHDLTLSVVKSDGVNKIRLTGYRKHPADAYTRFPGEPDRGELFVHYPLRD